MSIQESLQQKFAVVAKRLYDYKYIRILGSDLTKAFIIDVQIDKFQNTLMNITDYYSIQCRIEFPGHEIPVYPSGDDNQTSNNVLMLYDILPIEGYFLSTDNVKKGNIILYKYKIDDNNFQVIPLQLVNEIIKGGITDSLIKQFILAPPTDNNIINNQQYLSLIESFRTSGNW